MILAVVRHRRRHVERRSRPKSQRRLPNRRFEPRRVETGLKETRNHLREDPVASGDVGD